MGSVSAKDFYQQQRDVHASARDTALQDQLLEYCASLSGVKLI
jgi:hypothetical protein